MKSKAVIIGAGSVGTAIAYAMMIRSTVRELVLVDMDIHRAEGEALDLNHGIPYVLPIKIRSGTYNDCSDADLIIITAGAKQRPDETRLNLIDRNLIILKSIISSILENIDPLKIPVLLIVSNPCDILTYAAWKFSGFPREKVLGSGTVLDSARLRFELAMEMKVDARNVHGYVIGEHGDSEMILWSGVRIGGQIFEDYCRNVIKRCKDSSCRISEEISGKVKNAAYTIIKAKGYTNLGVGLAVDAIAQAILRDQNTVLPISSVLNGEYGLEDVALSVPCVVNKQGRREFIFLPLSSAEKESLHNSANSLKEIIRSVQI